MSNQSDGGLLFLIGGTVLGLITGLIFVFVQNDLITGIFGFGYSSFMIGMIVTLLAFAFLGTGLGWLFVLLAKR